MRRRVRLGDLFSVKHGFAFPGDEFSEDPAYPTVTTPGNFAIGGGFKQSRPKTFSGEVDPEYVLEPGSLVLSLTDLSKSSDTLGSPALVPSGRTYLHNQRIGLVVPKVPECVPRFLSYYLRLPGYRHHVVGTASGSTVKHTSPSRIYEFEASIPDTASQFAIADVLSALDDKIAANTKLATTALELALAIYRRAVNRLPLVSMSSVLAPILGGTPARSRADYWDGDALWISARDVTGAGRGVILDTAEKITDIAVAATKAKPLQAGSVILTARGTVGAVARLGRAASFNQSCYGFEATKIPAGVLYFMIREASESARAHAHGSVFDTITMKTFDDLVVPKFSDEVLRNVEGCIAPLLETVTATEVEARKLAVMRDALLPALMSGRLTVRDAEATVESAVDGSAVGPEARANGTLW
ncbi:restriction endonuclease subunit S [Promicromonospora aerolata]|uniref:Restriction endonuclease subunit S n=1 Tax=Promicromonospora aerolata TaxID=195749 RepID=A0ABW4V467_9MICO